MTSATGLLIPVGDLEQALGPGAELEPSKNSAAVGPLGEVVSAAARDAAYRSFTGHVTLEGSSRPVTVGEMALVFDSEATALSTFDQVARAAHLRTRMSDSGVAVETVTATNGLVSYWGYVHRGNAIVVLTLDTVHPLDISMSTFRSLVLAGAERIEAAQE
jgi:hypothetical protein